MQMRTTRLRRLQRAPLLRRIQRWGQTDRGPPGARERAGSAAPGRLGDMARAATDLDDAVPSRADAPRAETLQQGFAVAAAAQPGVREAEQVGDGALDFVEAPARSDAVPAVVRPVRILHRASLRVAHAALVAPGVATAQGRVWRRQVLEEQDTEPDGGSSERGVSDDLVRQREVPLGERSAFVRRDEAEDDLRCQPRS